MHTFGGLWLTMFSVFCAITAGMLYGKGVEPTTPIIFLIIAAITGWLGQREFVKAGYQ